MIDFTVSRAWKTSYPGAAVGILAMRNVANPAHHAALEQRKEELEQELRSRFGGFDRAALRAIPTLQAYHAFYKRFKKTYHVQLQLESVVLKGKPIPSVATLVEAMFMAELNSLLLTAGHDLEQVRRPVGIEVARGGEHFVRMNGQEQKLKAGDMYIADAEGVLSSVIYGPARRAHIGSQTRQVLFTVYAAPGISPGAVREHLGEMRANVQLVTPDSELISLAVYGTD